MPHKLQKPLAVLSGRLQYLAEVAQSPNARERNDVGEVHPIPSSPSLVALPANHASYFERWSAPLADLIR